MALERLTSIPSKFVAGDTIKWRLTYSDYPATTWQLNIYLRGPVKKTWAWSSEITASGSDFDVDVAASVTAAYPADDDYWLFAYVTDGTQRQQVYSAKLAIKPDLAATTDAYDGRTHAKKMLDAIEATLEGRATREEMSYTVNAGGIQQQVSLLNFDELIKARQFYADVVKSEEAAERIANGTGKSGRQIYTRFTDG